MNVYTPHTPAETGALALFCMAVADATDSGGADEFPDLLHEGFQQSGADLMDTIPDTFAAKQIDIAPYVDALVPKVQAEVDRYNSAWAEKLTVEQLGEEFGDGVYTDIALNAAGHGVSINDDPAVSEKLEALGLSKPEHSYSLEGAGFDEAWSALTDYQNAMDGVKAAARVVKLKQRVKADLELWQTPRDYAGEEYPGYYVGLSQHRDSGPLERANFEAMLEKLGGESEKDGVIVARASHWAVGWVETILVQKDSPKVAELDALMKAYEDYPVIDEDKLSQVETEQENKDWENWAKGNAEDKLRELGALEDDADFDSLDPELADTIRTAFSTAWGESGGDLGNIDQVVAAAYAEWDGHKGDRAAKALEDEGQQRLPGMEASIKAADPTDPTGEPDAAPAPTSSGTLTLTFKTDELLKDFGLPSIEKVQDDLIMGDGTVFSEDDIRNTMEDHNVPAGHEEEVADALRFTEERLLADKAAERIKDALGACLDSFSDYRYEFMSESEGNRSYSGIAKGIISYDIDWDTTTITADADLAMAIADCIAGVGMFDVAPEEDPIDPQAQFHQLSSYWEIYGDHKPEADLDNLDSWSGNQWRTALKDMLIEQGVPMGDKGVSAALTEVQRKRQNLRSSRAAFNAHLLSRTTKVNGKKAQTVHGALVEAMLVASRLSAKFGGSTPEMTAEGAAFSFQRGGDLVPVVVASDVHGRTLVSVKGVVDTQVLAELRAGL